MTSVTIFLKDGTKREFPHGSRAGGSWTNSVRYEGQFVIVRTPYETDYAFPASEVKEVKVDNL